VKLEFQPMGKLVQSLAAGYRADMVIVTSEVLRSSERDGRVARWRRQAGRARRHSAWREREGAATRHFHTRSFKRTLLRGALGGLHRPEERDQRQACRGDSPAARNCRRGESKATLVRAATSPSRSGRGEIELGIHQISEILR